MKSKSIIVGSGFTEADVLKIIVNHKWKSKHNIEPSLTETLVLCELGEERLNNLINKYNLTPYNELNTVPFPGYDIEPDDIKKRIETINALTRRSKGFVRAKK